MAREQAYRAGGTCSVWLIRTGLNKRRLLKSTHHLSQSDAIKIADRWRNNYEAGTARVMLTCGDRKPWGISGGVRRKKGKGKKR